MGNWVHSGVVFDKNTGLEWFVGPDRDTTWNDAKAWVESLDVAGGGWRMPTEEELRTLYKYGAGTRNMTPLLKTTGWLVWTGEASNSSSAWMDPFLPQRRRLQALPRHLTPRSPWFCGAFPEIMMDYWVI